MTRLLGRAPSETFGNFLLLLFIIGMSTHLLTNMRRDWIEEATRDNKDLVAAMRSSGVRFGDSVYCDGFLPDSAYFSPFSRTMRLCMDPDDVESWYFYEIIQFQAMANRLLTRCLGGERARAKYFENGEWNRAGLELPDYLQDGRNLNSSAVAMLIRAECG